MSIQTINNAGILKGVEKNERERTKNGDIEVSAVDPIASMIAVKNENLGALAQSVQNKLKLVIENLQ